MEKSLPTPIRSQSSKCKSDMMRNLSIDLLERACASRVNIPNEVTKEEQRGGYEGNSFMLHRPHE